jgi:hypothetical protein
MNKYLENLSPDTQEKYYEIKRYANSFATFKGQESSAAIINRGNTAIPLVGLLRSLSKQERDIILGHDLDLCLFIIEQLEPYMNEQYKTKDTWRL